MDDKQNNSSHEEMMEARGIIVDDHGIYHGPSDNTLNKRALIKALEDDNAEFIGKFANEGNHPYSIDNYLRKLDQELKKEIEALDKAYRTLTVALVVGVLAVIGITLIALF